MATLAEKLRACVTLDDGAFAHVCVLGNGEPPPYEVVRAAIAACRASSSSSADVLDGVTVEKGQVA